MEIKYTLQYIPLAITAALLQWGCVVTQHCFDHGDCKNGRCVNGRCTENKDSAVDSQNDALIPIKCTLPCQVKVANRFCIDKWEASRPDATATTEGTAGGQAGCVKGVFPWQVSSNNEAHKACEAAGKRLCTPAEWQTACQGPGQTVYSYGDTYNPKTCNGIDTFGYSNFHLTPTGSFPNCVNSWGVFDMNGNLWEHVAQGDTTTVRGGAFNCGDSLTLHRCDYIPGWTPSALGFRCCSDGVPLAADAGSQGDRGPEAGADQGKADQAGPDQSVDMPIKDLSFNETAQ